MGLREQLANVKLLALDFDGVLTDNHVYVNDHGQESVLCYRGDGIGIESVKAAGVRVIVLSTETNPVVTMRCQKLRVECYQSLTDKASALRAVMLDRCTLADVAYLGNDVNDLPALTIVGVPIVTADCEPALLREGFHQTTRRGGYGAVREVCDLIVEAKRRAGMHARGSIEPFAPIVKQQPWGTETLVASTPEYTGKVLRYTAGKAGGLQYHRLKDETFYLYEGAGRLNYDDGSGTLMPLRMGPGDSVHIPAGAVHRFTAITDCIGFEASTNHENDRVRVEAEYGEPETGGLPTTWPNN